jgi:hypothetical protein
VTQDEPLLAENSILTFPAKPAERQRMVEAWPARTFSPPMKLMSWT